MEQKQVLLAFLSNIKVPWWLTNDLYPILSTYLQLFVALFPLFLTQMRQIQEHLNPQGWLSGQLKHLSWPLWQLHLPISSFNPRKWSFLTSFPEYLHLKQVNFHVILSCSKCLKLQSTRLIRDLYVFSIIPSQFN